MVLSVWKSAQSVCREERRAAWGGCHTSRASTSTRNRWSSAIVVAEVSFPCLSQHLSSRHLSPLTPHTTALLSAHRVCPNAPSRYNPAPKPYKTLNPSSCSDVEVQT